MSFTIDGPGRYVTRSGIDAQVESKEGGANFPWRGTAGGAYRSWKDDGAQFIGHSSPCDLVARVAEPERQDGVQGVEQNEDEPCTCESCLHYRMERLQPKGADVAEPAPVEALPAGWEQQPDESTQAWRNRLQKMANHFNTLRAEEISKVVTSPWGEQFEAMAQPAALPERTAQIIAELKLRGPMIQSEAPKSTLETFRVDELAQQCLALPLAGRLRLATLVNQAAYREWPLTEVARGWLSQLDHMSEEQRAECLRRVQFQFSTLSRFSDLISHPDAPIYSHQSNEHDEHSVTLAWPGREITATCDDFAGAIAEALDMATKLGLGVQP